MYVYIIYIYVYMYVYIIYIYVYIYYIYITGSYLGFECNVHFLQMPYFWRQVTIWD